ncbi:non-structural maintenance of chromosomes element 4 homolog A isoform X2 [Camelus dromedarius]|uniref:non-structural maintenance of chromosomes element 4 homolog A isoform X2 n=1 Tax=Camelus dromedarius TaxID=9838 RepID=UPI00311A0644
MSGDSSGRRSEGRGRGRDPHRDRTRSRSRSRSPLSPVSRRGAAPERREAPERPSLEDTEPSDSGDEMMDPASLEAETDHGLCRQIRHQYRALINSVQLVTRPAAAALPESLQKCKSSDHTPDVPNLQQWVAQGILWLAEFESHSVRSASQRLQEWSPLGEENREDILNASDKLTEVLEEANTLFNGVSRAREAVLDAQFLVLASDLGKEKAKQLRSDLNSFDMLRYVETLLTHMGVNPLEAEELIRDEDSSDFEFIVYDSWKISGKTAENTFNKTHTFHFLLGSIQGEAPVPKPRVDRPRKVRMIEEQQAMPAQLKRMEESHQEATEKEVERILGLLQTYFQEDPDTPMSFFDFVIDPHSFPRTVENIFHVSFIIRDGFARIRLDQDRLPIIGK